MFTVNLNISSPKTATFKAQGLAEAKIYINGQLFAVKPFLSGLFKYNLPHAGKWTITAGVPLKIADVKPLEIIKKDIVLPIQDRAKNPVIKGFYRDNQRPNTPARIASDLGKIILSPSFYKYPIEVRMFILLHEVGHFYYTEEWKCDTFAAYHFLQMGYNPSQAFESLAGVLHDNPTNDHRIENIYNLLKK